MNFIPLKSSIDMFNTISNYQDKDILLGHNKKLSNLWKYHFQQGVYEILANKNSIAAKQNFYDASIISLYETEKRNADVFLWGLNSTTAILLSDNQLVQELFTTANNDELSLMRNSEGSILNAFQNILKGDNNAVLSDITNMINYSTLQKGTEKDYYVYSAKYFNALLVKDKDSIISAIQLFLTPNFLKNSHSGIIIDDYIAGYQTSLLKLVWLQGLEIEIAHPLIPMDLMPIKRNQEYVDTHNLLKEFVHQ